MAEARSVSGKQLVCSICQKTFTEMMVSSCFHTFCLDCIGREMSRYGSAIYYCPICKTAVTLPNDVVSNLKSDGYVAVDPNKSHGHVDSTVSKVCDICSDGRLATSRCMQCEEYLCQTCTNAHLKMKASRYHRQHVIPLQGQASAADLSMDTDRSRSHKFCWRHRGEEIQFICKQCNVVLCLICKLLEHGSHVTKPISEEAKEVRGRLNHLMQRSMKHGELLHMKVQELDTKQAKYPLELGQQLNQVNYQASQMHTQIEEEKRKVENELKSHYGNYLNKYEMEGEHLRKEYDEYRAINMEALQLLNSDDDIIVAEKGNHLGEKLKKIDTDFLSSSRAIEGSPSKKYEYGTIDTHQLHTMMGQVKQKSSSARPKHVSTTQPNDTSHSYPQTPEFRTSRPGTEPRNMTQQPVNSPNSARGTQVKPTSRGNSKVYYTTTGTGYPVNPTSRDNTQVYQTVPGTGHSVRSNRNTSTAHLFTIPYEDEIGYIYGIAPAGNNRAWVSLLDHRCLMLVSHHGDIDAIVDIGEVCEDVCSDLKGGCYVTCPRARTIKHVTGEGDIETILSELPDTPHGICMGQLKFDQADENEPQNELYVCFTEILEMNASVYDDKKGCVRIFSQNGDDLEQGFYAKSPIRIDVHSETNALCISDHTNGCLTISDSTGQFVKALYTGSEDNEDESFKPLGVCFDRHGNMVIADWQNNCVSLIGQEGDFIRNLMCDVEGPQSVAVDNGTLWVGGKSGTIQVCELDSD